ncbi:MAG TPA: hypothetical protein VMO52_01650 [Acidimicrobiia bacterium]|nr:hypothetical protein [Acidimicrobiia bacterium]
MFGLEIIIDGLESRLGLQHPPTKKCESVYHRGWSVLFSLDRE